MSYRQRVRQIGKLMLERNYYQHLLRGYQNKSEPDDGKGIPLMGKCQQLKVQMLPARAYHQWQWPPWTGTCRTPSNPPRLLKSRQGWSRNLLIQRVMYVFPKRPKKRDQTQTVVRLHRFFVIYFLPPPSLQSVFICTLK